MVRWSWSCHRYECQWEDDTALDSTEEGSRSIHYRADGTECFIKGDELRSLMRRINEQRMMVRVRAESTGCKMYKNHHHLDAGTRVAYHLL